jgi:hypothetical protein
VGSFVVALDDHPVLIDVGVETYTRKTFSPERYEIWTMPSLYHNLPAIDGQGQAAGREFEAREVAAEVTAERASLTLNIAPAYPAELGVERWQRSIRLERGSASRVVLEDRYQLRAMPRELALHLMVSGAVDTSQEGVLSCATPTRPLLVRYDPQVFRASVEEITIDDARLGPVWGERVYRTTLQARQPKASGSWVVTAEAGG